MANSEISYIDPPSNCDVCKEPIKNTFYDAMTKFGPWANMCSTCFKTHSNGRLGMGLGQQYELKKGGYVKVAG